MVLVRKRTIPTERFPLVGEVSANFLRIEILLEINNDILRARVFPDNWQK
jgi:hypothetical protein